MTKHHTQLGAIRTFDSLVKYLRDEMGWPIGNDSFEDLTFEYSAEELGIDAKNAAKVTEIKRLRPLASGQPWGIFFVKFEPKRLPVVALRRILSQVVLKKRATAKAAELAAWAADDLLFVSNYGEDGARHISFAHFSTAEGGADLPTLKVLGWDNLDTPLHLDDVAEHLRRDLAWPKDENDAKAWRKAWRGAFTLGHREVITTSRELSIKLAEFARAIRDRIGTALAIENAKGPLTVLMKAFQGTLVHDLDAAGFADMYAQTIAYGLLSSRIADPRARTADDFAAHMRTNPFLRELMQTFLHVGGRRGKAGGPGIDFDELGVSEVIDLLDRANMEAVVRDFGDRNPQEDPIIHFYELFLKEYDAKKRMQRGVFYTPRPVVSFIVRSVDELLRTEFGLADGLADTTSWAEMAKRMPGLVIPQGTPPEQPFVQILDPATGTGTFLVEVIGLIHQTMVNKWKTSGKHDLQIAALWNDYVPNYLLRRLHGYEILMAPYAIAHLKVGLKLYETGYHFQSDERARIYLTNALEPASGAQKKLDGILPALAHEAEAVNIIKADKNFTVLVGNPPYANYSANLSDQARSLVDKYRMFRGKKIKERNQLQFERNLQDDFVKFISIGESEIKKSQIGILSYITNATMLASNSLRGMRENLLREFTLIQELHLHGGVNEIGENAHEDQNVFEIAQAVGIHSYVRQPKASNKGLHFSEIWGPRNKKYAELSSSTFQTLHYNSFKADEDNCAFIPSSSESDAKTMRVSNVFKQFGAGIKTNQDAVAIAFTKKDLRKNIAEFEPTLAAQPTIKKFVQPILYRPFDERVIFYHDDVVASRSLPTMKHFLDGDNIGLIASSTWTSEDRFSVGVSKKLIEMKTGTHDRGTTIFPLYRYEGILGGRKNRVHNFNADFLSMWTKITATRIAETRAANTTHPEDLFRWIYAVCHSPAYRLRYSAALAQGFPMVMFPKSHELFSDLVRLGEELVSLHLMESPRLDKMITTYIGPTEPEVSRLGWSADTVWIDAGFTRGGATPVGSVGFRGVRKDVWDFYFGGYPVCEKWLKDRKGRNLSAEDITHYQKIIVAISETIRLMGEVDAAIEGHGGWPGAFAAAEAEA